MAKFERRKSIDTSRVAERKQPKLQRKEQSTVAETKLSYPKFRVKWDGKYISGITEISGLIRFTEVLLYRAGVHPNRPLRSPGVTAYEPIVFTRKRTHDSEFEKWVNKVYNWQGGQESSLKDFRKDIIIDIFNNKGQLAMSFKVFRCWPSEYSALGPLTIAQRDEGLEVLTLEHEGFLRDYEVVPPQ